jgi:hypothetical protein
MIEEKLLQKLLHERKEQDWYDFKRKLKLYDADEKLVDQQRDEFIKDILGLANGNSHIIRKTKYLIIGVDDKKFDDNDMRVLYDVDYKVPSQSDVNKWLNSASSPSIAGLECGLVPFQGVNLFVVTIPPTFNLHETTRELVTPGRTFHKYTVFMRQDENTVPASVRDGVTIQQLKHLHRQEIANPSSIWISAGERMSDIKLFQISGNSVSVIEGQSVAVERSLQTLIERHLETFLGVRFLASEYATGKTHGGRIDTLGIDENRCPVIIEYKRALNENVINQGLYYLDWLLDHKAEFTLLVQKKFGQKEAEEVDWPGARLALHCRRIHQI